MVHGDRDAGTGSRQAPKLLRSASSSSGTVLTSEQGFKMRFLSLEYKASVFGIQGK